MFHLIKVAITCIDFGFLFFQGTTIGIFQAYFLLKQGIQRLKKLQAELSGRFGISPSESAKWT